jgi:prevent-host-death family protein
MITLNIHEAKTHFSKIIKQACQGEEVIIAKAGVPIIRLVPIEKSKKERIPGTAKGKIMIADDFDAPLPKEIIESFEK